MKKTKETVCEFIRELIEDYEKVQSEIKEKFNVEVKLPEDYEIRQVCEYLMDIREYDEELYKHSIAVSFWSVYIGEIIGLNQKEMTELFVASSLHDIGKLLVPEDIIKKANKLEEVEKRIIETHPSFGVYYISYKKMVVWALSHNRTILNIIEQHHEALNGRGYPNQLVGQQIGTGARIVAIADKFEAYGAKRIYHEERSLEDTIEFLNRQANDGIIDKDILSEFIKKLQKKG